MRNYLRRLVHFLSSLSLPLVLTGPGLPGCGGQVVHPAVNLVDRTTAALSLGSFMEINGSFGAGCTSRSGAWSVGINGFAALTNPALSVIQGDSGCILDVASARIGTPATSSLYAPTDQITMWSAYNQIGRAFMSSPGGPADFYANLRIAPDITFTQNFTIDMVYSQDPSRVTGSIIASYYVDPVVSSTASASGVSPPDYTLDLSGLMVQVTDQKIVRSATGNALLHPQTVVGQSYVVSSRDLGPSPSLAALDAEFAAGTKQFIGLSDPSELIPAVSFALLGADLSGPTTRTLIVANELAAVRSYEVFALAVSAP